MTSAGACWAVSQRHRRLLTKFKFRNLDFGFFIDGIVWEAVFNFTAVACRRSKFKLVTSY